MAEMHSKQPAVVDKSGFTYSACGRFTKSKEKKKRKSKETADWWYAYQSELGKDCFQHDMAYGDLTRRTAFDKTLRDKAFDITKNPKYDGYQGGWLCFNIFSILYK